MVDIPTLESEPNTFVPADQSEFVANQAALQAPPTTASNNGKKKTWMYLLAGLVVIFLLIGVLLGKAPRKRSRVVAPSPTPAASAPLQVTQMQEAINETSQIVNNAQIEEQLLPPPQVDMKVDF